MLERISSAITTFSSTIWSFMVNNIGNIFSNVATIGITLLAKLLWDQYIESKRLQHVQNIFGKLKNVQGKIIIVLPYFEPLASDNFDSHAEKSYLIKEHILNQTGTRREKVKVPLYSKVIVLDDYIAFKYLGKVLANYHYGSLEFCGDIDALKKWNMNLVICIGGPRSNQKLKQILNTSVCSSFIEVDDTSETLSGWKITLFHRQEEISYLSTEERALAYIFKVTNPYNYMGKIIAVAGDSACSTSMAAQYLSENFVNISQRYRNEDFILLLEATREIYVTIKILNEFKLR